jgi:hypothetical protein
LAAVQSGGVLRVSLGCFVSLIQRKGGHELCCS